MTTDRVTENVEESRRASHKRSKMEEKVASGRISFADAVLVLAGRLEVGISKLSKLSVVVMKTFPCVNANQNFEFGRLQRANKDRA